MQAGRNAEFIRALRVPVFRKDAYFSTECKYAASLRTARARCDTSFFSPVVICAKVRSYPSGMNSGSNPNPSCPVSRSMMRPSTIPSKRCSSPSRISDDHRAEPCPAVGLPFEVFQQQPVVGREVVPVGGVACRVYARGSAQRFDFEPRVVGEAIHSGAFVQVMRLLRGVAFEGILSSGISSCPRRSRGAWSSLCPGPSTAAPR